MHFRLTFTSSNRKTGPIPVSTSDSRTCPDSCPLKGNGCYASGGPLGIVWKRLDRGAGKTWKAFLADVAAIPAGSLWRHNQAGDLPGHLDAIDSKALRELTSANAGKLGFTYTHKPVIPTPGIPAKLAQSNRQAVANANKGGFTVNLSADSLAEADSLADTGAGPVVVTLPTDAPKTTFTSAGRKVIVCPATYREGVTCASCQLCQRRERSVIIGFPAHGSSARKVSQRLKTTA